MRKYALALEIAAVILLIALIAGVGLPAYNRSKDKAKEAEVKNNLHLIQLVIEKYAVDHDGQYPEYLIGGDVRFAPNLNPETIIHDAEIDWSGITTLQPTALSDPLLRSGYLESYPRNPFGNANNRSELAELQETSDDPLRNSVFDGAPSAGAAGDKYGCRFGAWLGIMGNVSCDYRYPTFEVTDTDGKMHEYPSYANFEGFPFYDVWENGQPKFYLPGEFFYKANGPVVATEQTADNIALQPVEIRQYVLGGYGSIRTKGEDVLGPESEIIPYSVGPGEPSKMIVYPSYQARKPITSPTQDTYIVVPDWTRWLNIKDGNGISPGSPYRLNEEVFALEQILPCNPNGIPDAIVLVLTSEDKEESKDANNTGEKR